MRDKFNRKTVLKDHGVIAYVPSRLPRILSFLITGALFAAALFLTFSQASAVERDDAGNVSAHDALLLPVRQTAELGGQK